MFLREPARHQVAVFLLEGWFLGGRHVAKMEPIEHVAPVVAVVALDEIRIELVDPQLALGLFRAMTTVTMLLKERSDTREGDALVRAKLRSGAQEAAGKRKRPVESEPARSDHFQDLKSRVQGVGPRLGEAEAVRQAGRDYESH